MNQFIYNQPTYDKEVVFQNLLETCANTIGKHRPQLELALPDHRKEFMMSMYDAMRDSISLVVDNSPSYKRKNVQETLNSMLENIDNNKSVLKSFHLGQSDGMEAVNKESTRIQQQTEWSRWFNNNFNRPDAGDHPIDAKIIQLAKKDLPWVKDDFDNKKLFPEINYLEEFKSFVNEGINKTRNFLTGKAENKEEIFKNTLAKILREKLENLTVQKVAKGEKVDIIQSNPKLKIL